MQSCSLLILLHPTHPCVSSAHLKIKLGITQQFVAKVKFLKKPISRGRYSPAKITQR
ncbi:hypothetical protein MIDIC_10068 [Alphaproteobacteria bacterium]